MGCLGTLHLPKGVPVQRSSRGSNTPNGQRTTTPPTSQPAPYLFVQCLGKPQREQAPPQNAALTRRALEEWELTLCENKTVAILEKLQEGRPALFQKDGGAMLIAIVLDRYKRRKIWSTNHSSSCRRLDRF